jgi:hypothetical protein
MPAIEGFPEALRRFIERGDTLFRCDDGDWDVEIEHPPPAHMQKYLPPDAVLIAQNGCGDNLFLTRQEADGATPGSFGDRVYVYRHEGPEIETFSEDLSLLTDPLPPQPTDHPDILYADGVTQVMLGDHISARDLLFRKEGRVVYVPGISKKNRELEHDGLTWIGIRFKGGSISGAVVDPETSCLKKSVRFLARSDSEVEEIGPYEDFD